MTAGLELRDLRVSFDTEEGEVRAVDGVDLDVRPGECLGIVGESGSGKSQLFLGALGLLAANGRVTGSATWDSRDLLRCTPDELRHVRGRTIGIVFQDALGSLTPHLTVGDQMREVLAHHLGRSGEAATAEARTLLERVRIGDAARRLDQYPHELSGGMRQRVMIALALASGPQLLILDEPTSALDVTVQAGLIDLLQTLRKELGLGLVLITHDFAVVHGLADRVGVMYAGRIVEEAKTADLFRAARHPYTAGLLGAMPRLSDPVDRDLATIPGQPAPGAPATGCAFAPRCERATEICVRRTPELEAVEAGAGRVACHHPLLEPVTP